MMNKRVEIRKASCCLRSTSFLSSRAIPVVKGEVSWEMGRSCIGSIDVAIILSQDLMKHLGDISPGFFSQIVPGKHVLGTLDQILHDPFPAVVCECHPINLRLSVALKKRICLWFPDKDEIALFGRQHHIIPIDYKHVASMIAYQVV